MKPNDMYKNDKGDICKVLVIDYDYEQESPLIVYEMIEKGLVLIETISKFLRNKIKYKGELI